MTFSELALWIGVLLAGAVGAGLLVAPDRIRSGEKPLWTCLAVWIFVLIAAAIKIAVAHTGSISVTQVPLVWMSPKLAQATLSIGLVHDLVGSIVIASVALAGILGVFHLRILDRAAQAGFSIPACTLSLAGLGLVWVSQSFWTMLCGFFLISLSHAILSGAGEKRLAFAWESLASFWFLLAGSALLQADAVRQGISLSEWMRTSESQRFEASPLSVLLIYVGMLSSVRVFPFIWSRRANQEGYSLQLVFGWLSQALAATAFGFRFQPFLTLSQPEAGAWAILSLVFVTAVLGSLQRQWRQQLLSVLAVVGGAAIADLCLGTRMEALALLCAGGLAVVGLGWAGENLEKFSTQLMRTIAWGYCLCVCGFFGTPASLGQGVWVLISHDSLPPTLGVAIIILAWAFLAGRIVLSIPKSGLSGDLKRRFDLSPLVLLLISSGFPWMGSPLQWTYPIGNLPRDDGMFTWVHISLVILGVLLAVWTRKVWAQFCESNSWAPRSAQDWLGLASFQEFAERAVTRARADKPWNLKHWKRVGHWVAQAQTGSVQEYLWVGLVFGGALLAMIVFNLINFQGFK